MKYDINQIAYELTETALGNSFYGNSLRVAKDLPTVTQDERWMLDRWANGRQTTVDGWDLQAFAIRIKADCS